VLRRTARTSAGVLGLLLLAGCAVAGSGARQSLPPTDPTSKPVPAAAAPSLVSASVLRLQVPSPINAYELTPAQAAQEKYLTERATQVCMGNFGLTYDPGLSASAVSQGVQIDQEFQSRMYGVSDPAAVRTYGYHLPTWTQGTAAPDLISALPPAELSVLEGSVPSYDGRAVPQGGCRGWAADQLTELGIDTSTGQPNESTAESQVVQIQTNSFEQAQSDPRVLAVFGEWSACMRTHGDSYRTPFDAAGDPRWATSAPTAPEIATAEQDLACKTQVNLLGVDSAVVADYQNTAISANSTVLATAKAQVAEQGTSLLRAMARFGS
jgi:hypothetical protein